MDIVSLNKVAPSISWALLLFFMRLLLLLFPILFLRCSDKPEAKQLLFEEIILSSGVEFSNDLVYTEEVNPYTFRNFYNGAGVAIGDINNDGLLDIYFAGNQVDNKLYLNLGGLKFKDITEAAGVACPGVWSTGVTFVDINADGLLDIYVCKSGNPDAPKRHNELFINNGDLTFTERAKEYGLDITGLSVQAAFFDFDKDGDLDCYLLTNSIKSVGNYDLVKGLREIPDAQGGGNKFLINEGGKFRDYTDEAGIYRSSIGFGLGITLGDFNNDSWPDIFISNDFFERDYLYINNQNGSFTESLTSYFESISMGSMGADFADLDNDGFPELFVTEMLPDSLHRKKTKAIFESWDKYQLNIQNGYHHQFPRNVLQKRISSTSYAEVGRLAGVAASEWSWGALLFDMDNDGNRDIFIANGIYKDLLDRDYLTYTGAEDNIRKMIRAEDDVIKRLIDLMPSSSFPNYAYRNIGDLTFENKAEVWGLATPMFSSGSAYGDLDNDGDLDLVLNNINGPAAIYRNNSDTSTNKSVSFRLSSNSQNKFAIGAGITAYRNNQIYFGDNFVTRGFQSSVQPNIHIGLGSETTKIDSVMIRWPDSGYSMLYDVRLNQSIILDQDSLVVQSVRATSSTSDQTFKLLPVASSIFVHNGSGVNDFNRERLLPMMYSNETPSLAIGDIDGDGKEEIYVGGGKDQLGSFITYEDGKFTSFSSEAIKKYMLSEETKGVFFDADNDGDLDLYMAAGGRFFPTSSTALMDRIFLNNGKGEFTDSPHPLPFAKFFSTSVVLPIDFDNDGDLDLIVGERFNSFVYGTGGRLFLLENNGSGLFTDVTKAHAPTFEKLGMVTDAVVVDIDNNGSQDLVVVGDWMPVTIFKNLNGNFVNTSTELGFDKTVGWWHTVESADLNKDGKPDFVIGNHGKNTFFKPGDRMYVNDFDENGSIEQIFSTHVGGKYYPLSDKDEFLSQLPAMKKDLLFYKDYGRKSLDNLFTKEVIQKTKIFQVEQLASILLLSGPNGYTRMELPLEAQYSSIYSLLLSDFDNDGVIDVLAGGNNYSVKPQFGRYDATRGQFFKGVLAGNEYRLENGLDLNIKGQIRDIKKIVINETTFIFFAKHDDSLEIFKIQD